MKLALTECVNGDGRPVREPSRVLCEECFQALNARFDELRRRLAAISGPSAQETKQ